MAKKTIFISFDYDKNRNAKYLLDAWNANRKFSFGFRDRSSKEIKSTDIPTVKGAITKKINSAKRTLVIVGAEATKKHKDSKAIGYNNWQSFEVAKSIANGNRLIVVKLKKEHAAPTECYGVGATWVDGFTEKKIIAALDAD